MLVLLLAAALAGPVDLATGADITAIRAIETAAMTDEEAVDAWRAFLLAFPDSPLATTAWRELDALQGTFGDWIPGEHQAALGRVARETREQDEEVARSLSYASVAELAPDGERLVGGPPGWMARASVDLGWDGLPYLGFGAGLGRGPLTGVLRIGRQRAWYAELAARLKGPLSFGPWVEVHVDSLLRSGLTGGGEVILTEGVALEARAGFVVDDGALFPRIGTAVVYRLPGSRLKRYISTSPR